MKNGQSTNQPLGSRRHPSQADILAQPSGFTVTAQNQPIGSSLVDKVTSLSWQDKG